MWDVFWGVLLAICFFCMFIQPGTIFGKDTTDGKEKRSGLVVYTDNATGVQYVASPFGMAARVDKAGNPYSDPADNRENR